MDLSMKKTHFGKMRPNYILYVATKCPLGFLFTHLDVSCNIFRLKRRMTTPFVSADRYDLKEAYEHSCWVVVPVRNFFRGQQSQRLPSLNAFPIWSPNV